jgi:hypothetical protein
MTTIGEATREQLQAWLAEALTRLEDTQHELRGAATCIQLWQHDRDQILAYLRASGHDELVDGILKGEHFRPRKARKKGKGS